MTDNSNRNLDFQFYFLLRTSWWQDEQYIQEPLQEFDTLHEKGIKIDTDKRLFRRVPKKAQIPLENWQAELIKSWNNICEIYRKADNLEENEVSQYCQNNLLGVALVIMDESLERHKVTLDLYNSQKSGIASYNYNTESIFSIQDKIGNMKAPATLHAFTPSIDGRVKTDNWSLNLDKELPYLKEISTAINNPVFVVYGLAHGDAETANGQLQNWIIPLQEVLCGDIDKEVKTTAILNGIIARFIINESVFETLDYEAKNLRFILQKETTHNINLIQKFEVKNIPNSILETQLRDMENRVVDTDHMLGRFKQAIKTLEINQVNFKWRLHHIQQEEKNWKIDWQYKNQYPPLLEPLHTSLENLQNHVVYIKGKLTQLKGTCIRWRSFITEHRHIVTENLALLANFIILLLALGELSKSTVAEDSYWTPLLNFLSLFLNHPVTYIIIIVIFSYIGLKYYFKEIYKRFKYKAKQSNSIKNIFKWLKISKITIPKNSEKE